MVCDPAVRPHCSAGPPCFHSFPGWLQWPSLMQLIRGWKLNYIQVAGQKAACSGSLSINQTGSRRRENRRSNVPNNASLRQRRWGRFPAAVTGRPMSANGSTLKARRRH